MPQKLELAAHLDTIFLHLSLAYCIHLLIKAVLLICSGKFYFRGSASSLSRLGNFAASKINPSTTTIASSHPTAAHSSTISSAVLLSAALPPKASVALTSSELSESATAQPPWLHSVDDLGNDAAWETDTALLKQAFRSMVRKRRGGCRRWLQERLADCGEVPLALRRPPPTSSFFGIKWLSLH